MALETASFISDLNVANPTATDPISDGDNHIRLIKSAIKATFPNISAAVTATAAQLNYTTTLTSDPQAQINSKASTQITLTAGAGLTGGGTLESNRSFALTGQALAFHNLAVNGLITRSADGSLSGRAIGAGSGISVSNADGTIGNPTIAVDATVLRNNTSSLLGAGFRSTPVALGNSSGQSITPNPEAGSFFTLTNNGAYTLNAPTEQSGYTQVIHVTNGSTAGATTFSGFAKVVGDALTTTNGHGFLIFLTKIGTLCLASVAALQ